VTGRGRKWGLGLVACLVLCALVPASAGARFRTVPGDSERVGSGETYRFKVEVERSIGIHRRAFAEQVERILFDRMSWTRSGEVAFKRVDRGGNTRVMLARPRTVDRLCRPLDTRGKYSCNVGEKVLLNLRRWRRGVPHWSSSRANYRRMLVNHEMGHRIGHGHRNCPGRGRKAPVMQQQTISLQGCEPNWWPLRRELRATAGASAGASAASAARDRWRE